MARMSCRACRGTTGELVLDLGAQPPCDLFPPDTAPGPDPLHPLRMWLCGHCGLAQLVEDPGQREEPAGIEPQALTQQAGDAITRLAEAGLVRAGGTVAEYGSPHGGSWLPLATERGMIPRTGPVDLVLDTFGLMHEADQSAAMRERAARLRSGGRLLLQFHSLATILAEGQWNALRHGHFAYFSAPAMVAVAAGAGLRPGRSWTFPLYGGTVLLELGADLDPHPATEELLAAERAAGVTDPETVRGLHKTATRSAQALHTRLADLAAAGRTVVGYGAASRAVALLRFAGVDRELLPCVLDASPAKWGRRMPGTGIPIREPRSAAAEPPEFVLLFVPDLLDEVQAANPALSDAEWLVAS